VGETPHWKSLAVIVCDFAAFQTIQAEILKTGPLLQAEEIFI